MPRIDPLKLGAVPNDASTTVVARNTIAFQKALDQQAGTGEPIEVPGVFALGTIYPGAAAHFQGDNWRRSQLRFVGQDGALIDFDRNNVNPSGSILERMSIIGGGQSSPYRQTGTQFRKNGSSNRNVKIIDCAISEWSDAGVEIPNSWNCNFSDSIIQKCGAGIRLGYQTDQPDDLISSGNLFKNLYLAGNHHGIDGQPGPGAWLLFTHFELVICEFNDVGIHCPTSKDARLTSCYFEANKEHGAVLGHARIEGCRHRPGTTDDILLSGEEYPWEPSVSHHEGFVTERQIRLSTNEVRLLWAPRFGIVTIASSSPAGPNGSFRVKTYGNPEIAPIAMLPGPVYAKGELNGSGNSGKVTISADNAGGVWVQNRTGSSFDMTYHIVGLP